jgi:outer membrane protein
MKNKLTFCILLCLSLYAVNVAAQEPGTDKESNTRQAVKDIEEHKVIKKSASTDDLKIGIFDIQRIMKESKTINNYRETFLKNIESKKKPLQDRENLIKALDEKLKRDGKVMSPTDKNTFEEKLANEIKEIRRMKEDFNAETQKMDRELTQKIFSEIDAIVKKIAEQENYTIIFEKTAAGIVHFKHTVDITGKVIEQLK